MLGVNWLAGVYLQDHLRSLAAKNVGLKQGKPSIKAMISALDAFYADEDVPESAMLIAYNILRGDIKTPATDRIYAEFEERGAFCSPNRPIMLSFNSHQLEMITFLVPLAQASGG